MLIGQMHGNETGGLKVVKAAAKLKYPSDTRVWIIKTLNPDGLVAGTRKNSNGVDLNRNSPDRWKPNAGGAPFNPGPRPKSEPETKAYVKFLHEVDADLVLSFHGFFNAIDTYGAKHLGFVKRLGKQMHLRPEYLSCNSGGVCTGTLTGWFNHNHDGQAITVELPQNFGKKKTLRFATASRWGIAHAAL